mmetsp:Transcript_6580/g.13458  ORF Transcript_6580/g.13458 Transcript_6580/m.13458 type:complete len:216 (+) Transcript_6580:1769-2416(+)
MVTDRPSSAAFSAVEHPATPLPMTSRSASPISDNEASGAVVAEAVVASRPPSVLASGVLFVEKPDPLPTLSMAPLTPNLAPGGTSLGAVPLPLAPAFAPALASAPASALVPALMLAASDAGGGGGTVAALWTRGEAMLWLAAAGVLYCGGLPPYSLCSRTPKVVRVGYRADLWPLTSISTATVDTTLLAVLPVFCPYVFLTLLTTETAKITQSLG